MKQADLLMRDRRDFQAGLLAFWVITGLLALTATSLAEISMLADWFRGRPQGTTPDWLTLFGIIILAMLALYTLLAFIDLVYYHLSWKPAVRGALSRAINEAFRDAAKRNTPSYDWEGIQGIPDMLRKARWRPPGWPIPSP